MNITIIGCGYVGMSISTLLGQKNHIKIFDVDPKKIEAINSNRSPIEDNDIKDYLKNKKINIEATLDKTYAYTETECAIICTPTDYDPVSNFFDTTSVENTIKDIVKNNNNCSIIIKSTVPVGFTDEMIKKYSTERIVFSPEFLREGKALYDNLFPSRIVIGGINKYGKNFCNLLKDSAIKEKIACYYMQPSEAEAVKLFSNTYLAMRVSFFNELDSYASVKKLNTLKIIEGVSSDERIGTGYNNPSFGYGGYCLPKDTKQLLSNFKNVPQNLIEAIVKSNSTRKQFIADQIISLKPKIVGIYRLTMKLGSDNIRVSAIQGVMKRLNAKGIKILLYEPLIKENSFFGARIEKNLDNFKKKSSIILVNRLDQNISDVAKKIYTKDIFSKD